MPSFFGRGGFTNPMTTLGDLIRGGASGVATRLGLGAALQHLRTNAAADDLEYADPPVGALDISAAISHSTTQSIPDDTSTAILMDTEDFDTDTMHDLVTNNERITFNTAGKYIIGFAIRIGGNQTGIRTAFIRLNGTTTLVENVLRDPTTVEEIQLASTLFDFAVNDFIELIMNQNSGAALSTVRLANLEPRMWAIKVLG